jgi:hypothetical protein
MFAAWRLRAALRGSSQSGEAARLPAHNARLEGVIAQLGAALGQAG